MRLHYYVDKPGNGRVHDRTYRFSHEGVQYPFYYRFLSNAMRNIYVAITAGRKKREAKKKAFVIQMAAAKAAKTNPIDV